MDNQNNMLKYICRSMAFTNKNGDKLVTNTFIQVFLTVLYKSFLAVFKGDKSRLNLKIAYSTVILFHR